MNNKLIENIKYLINENIDNSVGMDIDVLNKTFNLNIIDEEKEEVVTIYEIGLNELLNKIFDNNIKLEWF